MVDNNQGQFVTPEPLTDASGPTGPAGPRGATGPAAYIGYAASTDPLILPPGTPARWATVSSVATISLQTTQAVKIDASFLLSWVSGDSGSAELNLEYRMLRNGTVIYTGANVYGLAENPRTTNQEFINFFHVDTAPSGSYTYTMQARINGYNNLQATIEILESDLSAVVYPNQMASQHYLFVSCWNDTENLNGHVAVIDTVSNRIVRKLFAGSKPGPMAISPDLTTLYVGDQDPFTVAQSGYNLMWVWDLVQFRQIGVVQIGATPVAIVVSPDNTKVYVANSGSRNVTVINNLTRRVIATVPVGTGTPFALTASPDGSYIFAACKSDTAQSDYIAAIRVANEQVTVFGKSYGLEFDTSCNPVAVSGNSRTFVAAGKEKAVLASLNSSSIGPFFSVSYSSLGGQWRSGLFIDQDIQQFHQMYWTEPMPSEEISIWHLSADNSPARWQTPVSYPSYKGQNQVVASADQLRICITVAASDDQFAGLQIIEPENNNTSHFVRLPVAREVAITANSAVAYVSEHRYVHPVNLQTFTEMQAIAVDGLVQTLLAAYRLQS